jgi:hypothetical protein
LSLEEAMLFWKTEFCKKIPAEKFEKEYAYAVRHAYGKEGTCWLTCRVWSAVTRPSHHYNKCTVSTRLFTHCTKIAHHSRLCD